VGPGAVCRRPGVTVADREPFADREPLAHREPLVDREPFGLGEPVAERHADGHPRSGHAQLEPRSRFADRVGTGCAPLPEVGRVLVEF
jgi:hypothetical protein